MPTDMLTIVAIDMVGYSLMAGSLDESVGPRAVELLHRKLFDVIEGAMSTAGVVPDDVAYSTYTGDGEIRYFKSASKAVEYAEAIHIVGKATREKWYFRAGVATGDVVFSDKTGASSYSITLARRLEAAAKPGEVLIDTMTHDQLPAEWQVLYAELDQVTDKHGKSHSVHRRSVVPLPKAGKGKLVLSDKVKAIIANNPAELAIGAAAVLSFGAFIHHNSLTEAHSHADGVAYAADLIQQQIDSGSVAGTSVLSELILGLDLTDAGKSVFSIIIDIFNPITL